MIRFRMLGSVELRDAQDRELGAVLRRPKLLALLGYLTIARPSGFHRRDTLVALLWPELVHAHARNALSQAVHALRQELGREVQRVVELLDRAGDRAGAVRAYQEFARRLGRDLEVEPSAATRLVMEGIRTRQPAQGVDAAESAAGAVLGERVAAPEPSLSDESRDAAAPRSPTARKRLRLGVALVVVGLLASGWLLIGQLAGAHTAKTTREPKTLVVLPFANLGPAGQQYFTDGVTEEITARLSAIGDLRVIASTSANLYRNGRKGIREIGAELGVDYVLEGSVRWERSAQGGARVRVTPQLITAA